MASNDEVVAVEASAADPRLDLFAAAALIGLLSGFGPRDDTAERCFAIAAEMLAASRPEAMAAAEAARAILAERKGA